DIGQHVIEERRRPQIFARGPRRGFVVIGEKLQSRANAEPAGNIETGLVPTEYPRNGSEVREAGLAGPARRPGADARVFEGVDGRGLAVKLDEARGIEKLPVRNLAGFGHLRAESLEGGLAFGVACRAERGGGDSGHEQLDVI